MKNLIITGLILLSYCLTAQEETKPNLRHEIGVNLFSYNHAYEWLPENTTGFDFGKKYAFVNGVSYRYHFEKSAMRFNFQYQYSDYNRISNGYDWEPGEIISGTIWSVETRVGYERYFGSKKVKPYTAIDLLYTYGFSDAWYYSCFDPTCDPAIPSIRETKMLGVVPSLGLSYQFTKRFSLHVESNLMFGVYQIEETSRIDRKVRVNDVERIIIFNPVSVFSVNFKL